MIHKEIVTAIDNVIDNIQESDIFKLRLRKLIESALTKAQDRSFRDDDLRELLELTSNEDDQLEFEDEEGEESAG